MAACGLHPAEHPDHNDRGPMQITWYGHAAFLIEAGGTRIILDPYRSPDSGGYAPIGEPADVVVVSHENDRYHSHLGQIVPPFEVVRGLEIPPGGVVARGIRFEAVRVFETPERLPGDEVTMVRFEVEGVRVAFLGDLGHPLDEAEFDAIGHPDVVLVPAGGRPTIDLDAIPPLLDRLRPRLLIPMHFKTPRINLDIRPVEEFLARMPPASIERARGGTTSVDAPNMPDAMRVVVLEATR